MKSGELKDKTCQQATIADMAHGKMGPLEWDQLSLMDPFSGSLKMKWDLCVNLEFVATRDGQSRMSHTHHSHTLILDQLGESVDRDNVGSLFPYR